MRLLGERASSRAMMRELVLVKRAERMMLDRAQPKETSRMIFV